MDFVFGTVLLVAAILMLGAARYAVTRYEESSWVRKFAATETAALLITMVTAFGIAFLCAGLASDRSGLGLTEFLVSLGVIALSVVGVARVFRRRPLAAPRKAPTGRAAA